MTLTNSCTHPSVDITQPSTYVDKPWKLSVTGTYPTGRRSRHVCPEVGLSVEREEKEVDTDVFPGLIVGHQGWTNEESWSFVLLVTIGVRFERTKVSSHSKTSNVSVTLPEKEHILFLLSYNLPLRGAVYPYSHHTHWLTSVISTIVCRPPFSPGVASDRQGVRHTTWSRSPSTDRFGTIIVVHWDRLSVTGVTETVILFETDSGIGWLPGGRGSGRKDYGKED